MTQPIKKDPPAFDYAALGKKRREQLEARESRIRKHVQDTAQAIIETGNELIAAKKDLGHGKFGAWLEAAFAWSHDTANKYMNVAKNFSQIPHGAEFEARALYLLGAKSTPPAARDEAITLAGNGVVIDFNKAKELVSGHKPPINSHAARVGVSSEGVTPDLDENGQPLIKRTDDEEDDDGDGGALLLGDIVTYEGHRCEVIGKTMNGRLFMRETATNRTHQNIPSEEVVFWERPKTDQPIEATTPATPVAPTPKTTGREIPVVDGMPIDESHPVGYAGLYATDEAIGYGNALCSSCEQRHNGWTAVAAGRWRCRCGETTNDDAMQIEGKEEYDLAQRLAKHGKGNGNGHKPAAPVVGSDEDDDKTNDEWGTPADWIAKARAFMGGIDTDPASNDAAQRVVKAKTYYTKRDNGMMQTWHGRVWLNPPYSQPLIANFTGEALRQYERGNISECLILVNNRTDAFWFQRLLTRADAVCFIKGRINFIHATKDTPGNRQGQVLFYLGKRADAFVLEFSDDGVPMQCMWAREAVQS